MALGFVKPKQPAESTLISARVRQLLDDGTLNNKDERVIKLLKLEGEKSRAEIQEFLRESKEGTRQRLNNLANLDLIQRQGQGRSTIYVAL